MNQIFGYQILQEDALLNNILFEGAQPVKIREHTDSEPWQVRLFAYPNTHLQVYISEDNKSCSYVWGIPAHPEIPASNIPAWCADVVAEKRYDRFRELLGSFIIIVDEPRLRRITFITDIMGVRPMFFGIHNGRIVFGSKVWPIQKAGLTKGEISYDAVSAWIVYGYNCTESSLFSDLHRLPPGSAVISQGGRFTEISYTKFEPKSESVTTEQVSEDLHDIVSSTVKTLLADYSRTSIALSGGYDSRYLLALSLLFLAKESIECATVSFTEEEGQIASQVAKTLGLLLKKIPVSGSIWDLYDQVYHFTADGFPISKFVTYCIAQRYPGLHMVNGFMGDPLMRGSRDMFLGKYETEWKGNLADVLQCKHSIINFRLFRKDIANRMQTRACIPMEEAVRKGSYIGKVFAWSDFYQRQRHYISNNFLQHIGVTEALLPFYSWNLLSYKMEHDYGVFDWNVYDRIFQRQFPELAKIPHVSSITPKKLRPSKVARCIKHWALQLLPVICNKNRLSLLSKKQCIPLTIAGLASFRRTEASIFTFKRLYLLEQRLRDASLDFDWEYI